MGNTISAVGKAAFHLRLKFWISRTRLRPTQVRFRHMTRRWALCRCDNSITFSIALLDQPLAFQDLVIVHELVHLRIPDHSAYFWLALELYQPDWRVVGRLAPESPVKQKQRYRIEDCPIRGRWFPQGRIINVGLTSPLTGSYRYRYGNTDSYRMD